MTKKKSIDYKSLLLGILLNVLVIIVFILLYHAYIVSPRIDDSQEIDKGADVILENQEGNNQ